MHIRSIIIDGFKSYGNRTEIGPFDSQFNAITGLNGTGKSNILDSICFVLGISNLSNVRATSLQDLVYKSGQAGITKASVSIIFDNTDKKNSPLGYEQYNEITITRQIQIGGKNKYIINGVIVQNKRVIDFFISMQLNVNNPNFLIMQGRITKVLNMKPIEILSLIEEAAGTRSYEMKKEIANKTVDKKCPKLQEMATILDEEVQPRLEKLRLDKVLFMDYQKLQRDLDLCNRLYIAYQYSSYKKSLNSIEKNNSNHERDIQSFHDKIKMNEQDCLKIDQQIAKMQEQNSEANVEIKKLDTEIKEHTTNEVSVNAKLKAIISSIKRENESLKLMQKSLKDDQDLLNKKEELRGKSDQIFQELKDADEKDSKALEIAEKRLMAISVGLSADEEGNAVVVQDQLTKAQETVINSQSLSKQYEMELNHFRTELSQLEKETSHVDTQYNKDKNSLSNLQKEIDYLKTKMAGIKFSEDEFKNLSYMKNQLTQEVRSTKYKLENLRAANERFNFDYQNPEPNFDRQRVRGVLCRLFKPISNDYRQALETCAGGRLYNIVVDTEETGKKLLKNGQLKNRVTIIPLNKITGYRIDKKMEDFAKNLVGAGKVHAAINVINYSPIDEPAMIHVFGGVFICEDLETANKIAFHPNIKRRCITLSGDTMDPAGTLSGGAVARGSSPLQVLYEMDNLEFEFKSKQEELQNISERISKMSSLSDEYKYLKHHIEVKNIELQTVQRQLEQTDFYRHQEDMSKLRKQIASHMKLLEDTKVTLEKAEKDVEELTSKLKDSKGNRERDIKEARKAVETARLKSERSKKNWQEREQEFLCMNIEISELKNNINESIEQINQIENGIKELVEQCKQLEEELKSLRQRTNELEILMKDLKNKLLQKNSEAQKELIRKENLEKENQNIKLDIKKSEQLLKKHQKDFEENTDKMRRLVSEYSWIKDEEELFGKPESCYDFKKVDIKEVSRKISTMMETKKTMERNLNHKAMSMLPEEESNFKNVAERKQTVEKDQDWIKGTLSVLDSVKRQTIEKAYMSVNKDFGSIFSTLLPGASAKLQPVDGKSISEGLEVKVSFNNVWKDSLSELSGGQRSLVALSLILAMLLYKPAPLYILDEVDAALDLSHTQNIGQMLKSHFKGSQFIIVSLKEGMFNNATVLFQTRFINGMSTVIRTVQEPKKRVMQREDDDHETQSKNKQKK